MLSNKGAWERGERYQAVVGGYGPEHRRGCRWPSQRFLTFDIVGYLSVSEVCQRRAATELDPDTVVTVVFDRPVVPLTAINRQEELPDPLTFVPPVRGEGEWLNTSIYLFRPEERLSALNPVQGPGRGGLADTSGGILEEDYTWEFATIGPGSSRSGPRQTFATLAPPTSSA